MSLSVPFDPMCGHFSPERENPRNKAVRRARSKKTLVGLQNFSGAFAQFNPLTGFRGAHGGPFRIAGLCSLRPNNGNLLIRE
ncbi:hypothetical protein IE4771_PB00063 (plasmid) [Rhizobium etli bv. mimosae str. IE4771]|uniref:Uncharacterized protein n=1 Tax=Rhizobium etli bv. mimosae str. IE4771 TaxID=1432050 RepID=A0A060I3R6_RHIET|nr:hypothetical protein IE4771_PB00063 [Rhizobium sp. IE4771]